MEMNSIESIKKLTIESLLKDKHINELYQNTMEQIIDAASNGQVEITTDLIKFDDCIEIEKIFKLLGYKLLRCVSFITSDDEIKLNISWL